MKRIADIWKWLLPSILLSVSSCVAESIDSCPEPPASETESYIKLQFAVNDGSSLTRGNPVGGEEGNGRENEIFNEETIHDINVFLFNSESGLMNAAPNTTLHHLYFNLDNTGDTDNSLKFEKGELADGGRTVYTVIFKETDASFLHQLRIDGNGIVRFLTVANLGRTMKGEVETLSDLTGYAQSRIGASWTGNGAGNVKDYDRFVMTTAYEEESGSKILFSSESGTGTRSDPFRGATVLERMCARIDLMYEASNRMVDEEGKVTGLSYDVDMAGTDKSKVHIMNMLPVNVMGRPSYVFKKVTNGLPLQWTAETGLSAYTWGGKEATDDKGIPNNYVLEPTTLLKMSRTDTQLSDWYGATRTASVKGLIRNDSRGRVGDYHSGSLPVKEFDRYTHMTVLGYANENTQSPDLYHSDFLTGIAFRAVYAPVQIFIDGEKASFVYGDSEDANFDAEGEKTIYRYSPSKTDEVKESESLYFSNEAACNAYQAKHPEEMAVVTKFAACKHAGKWGFFCYYNLWLKHYDDVNDANHSDPHAVFPMQYAIVRNNIYRVSVSFTGPGDPVPTMREPETMQARIFVRKWNKRRESDPLLF